jgi:hypothetical protein
MKRFQARSRLLQTLQFFYRTLRIKRQMHFFLALMLGVLCVALTLTRTFDVLYTVSLTLTLTFEVLYAVILTLTLAFEVLCVALTLTLLFGVLCVALTLTLLFGVLCVALTLTLTLTFGALFVAKKILSTENRDSSEFIDEVFCQRCIDEMLYRQKFFDEQHIVTV